jgi:branched-chain amino acid transport system ATP-binding protein
MRLLEVTNLHTNYDGIKAIQGISFTVEQREIVTLIGANGAGKSTTLNTIAGIVKHVEGDILFNGISIAALDPADRVKLGITLSPEGRQVFPYLSVERNLKLGAYTRNKKEMTTGFAEAYSLFPILEKRKNQLAGTLSGGEQQMLAVARAMMSAPRLLMLDEPSLGLAPIVVTTIFSLIKRINEMGTTILLVEQNARIALSVSNRAYVLETGHIVLSDTGENLARNEKVREAYLGGL